MTPRQRWRPLLDEVPVTDEIAEQLVRRYGEAHRAYHGVGHITALARLYAEIDEGPGWQRPVEVKLALLFHDAIYEPGARDNEARSATLARELLAEQREHVDLERVVTMIEATRDHGGEQTCEAARHDLDLAHFLDADMAILGTPSTTYDDYARAVRQELAAVPEPLYRAGRASFLRAQLEREQLFHSSWFGGRLDAQARANIARELESL